MIAYTLLSTSKKKDVVNVVLTTLILYAILCYSIPAQYRYYAVSALLVVDMFAIKWLGEPNQPNRKHRAPNHRNHRNRHRQHKRPKQVRVNPVPSVRYFETPSVQVGPVEPPIDVHSPAYRLSLMQPKQQGPPAYVMPYVAPQPDMESESESSDDDIAISETSSEITFSSEEL